MIKLISDMKRMIYLLLMAMTAIPAVSQPKLTSRAINCFPTALPLTEDDIEWQRDIYREVDISENENAGLFCHDGMDDTQEPLFSIIFKLVLNGDIPAYKYSLEGNEVFKPSTLVDAKDILDDYHIEYRQVRNHLEVDEESLPTQEVTCYYVKEGVYYDLTNSAFRRRVLALCPVIVTTDDEFGEGETKFPLFWVRYIDLEPFLKAHRIIPDSRNKAAVMNMSDYFTLTRYKGPIYKVNNAQGLSLSQYCEDDSLILKEQMRIEAELKNVQKHTYNTFPAVQPKKAGSKEKKRSKKVSFLGITLQRSKDADKEESKE